MNDSRKQILIDRVRDVAVNAVMKHGRLEASGDVRLAVLRCGRFMIAYRTPFNPLPPLSEIARYLAAQDGKTACFAPYGLDIWELDVGKVLSIGWLELGSPSRIDHYRRNNWEVAFETAACNAASDEATAMDPRATEQAVRSTAPANEKTVRGARQRRRPAV